MNLVFLIGKAIYLLVASLNFCGHVCYNFTVDIIKTGLGNLYGLCCFKSSLSRDTWVRCTVFRFFFFHPSTRIDPNFAHTPYVTQIPLPIFYMLSLARGSLKDNWKNMLSCLFNIWRKTDTAEVGFISSSSFGWVGLSLIPTTPAFCEVGFAIVSTHRLTLDSFLLN